MIDSIEHDCDDMDMGEGPVPAFRPIRTRRTIGAAGERTEEIVACPFLPDWPTVDACVTCEHARGRDGIGIACARRDDACLPAPEAPCERSRARRTRVGEVMSDPICVRADADARGVAELLPAQESALPVVDEQLRPIGIVSALDLVHRRAEGTARDLMTSEPVCVRDNATLADGVATLAKHGIQQAIVVSESGRIVGILGLLDIARWLRRAAGVPWVAA